MKKCWEGAKRVPGHGLNGALSFLAKPIVPFRRGFSDVVLAGREAFSQACWFLGLASALVLFLCSLLGTL